LFDKVCPFGCKVEENEIHFIQCRNNREYINNMLKEINEVDKFLEGKIIYNKKLENQLKSIV